MEKRKIAIPLSQGIMAAHFGHCEQFALFEIEDKSIASKEVVNPPAHEPGVFPLWLKQQNVDDVIAGGMGQKAINLFLQNKINVYVGAPQKEAEELVLDLLHDNLQAGENLCDH
ncbi:MAG: NifB/NifX family molybdenum-iron cluster-binding protein [Bacteroidales bacterium]|nr:NifB/NifX family molybdenum-iron cluster-binding protein [Bacteroidales bacterium]MCF8387829.1 NifB/NifX family molybdenum-iron cluster-binding protein [Bacteroidales bacterium]MCF8396605.1 NifB/NifX family molybdenum-iron cluster-binding protein [Bacteroidales bacterium]